MYILDRARKQFLQNYFVEFEFVVLLFQINFVCKIGYFAVTWAANEWHVGVDVRCFGNKLFK